MQLGSGIAVAVAVADSYSTDSTPRLGTSIYHRCGPIKQKKKKERKKDRWLKTHRKTQLCQLSKKIKQK